MPAIENPQTTKLVVMEHEKTTLRQETLDYKSKVLQLEQEKVKWSHEKT